MRRTRNVRNSLRPSRRDRGAENTIISGGISFIPPGSDSLRFQSGAKSESARLFTAVGMEVDDARNTNGWIIGGDSTAQSKQGRTGLSLQKMIVDKEESGIIRRGKSLFAHAEPVRQTESEVTTGDPAPTGVCMSNPVDGIKPSNDGHCDLSLQDSVHKDDSQATQTLEPIATSNQVSMFHTAAADMTSSMADDKIVQQDDSGTSEIEDYAAVIDDFSQTVPELKQ